MELANDRAPLLARLLPAPVACAECFDDPPGGWMFEAERAAVARAIPRRQAEYRTVRHCARLALRSLGVAPAPILSGPRREPLWPAGVVGSMTHCPGYRAAALARRDQWHGIGVDAEPDLPLPDGVLEAVADPAERVHLAELAAADPLHWDRLLFCVKEAVYKVWFPLAGRWLGFEHARVSLDPGGAFRVRLSVSGPVLDGRPLTELTGRWTVREGLIVTAIALPRALAS